MNIHIDASRALEPRPTGVAVYAQEIIFHLAALACADDKIILYAPAWLASRVPEIFGAASASGAIGVAAHDIGAHGALPPNCEWKFLRWPPKYLWTQICLAHAWWRVDRVAVARGVVRAGAHASGVYERDIFFAPGHVAPFFAPARTFVTIHDIAFEFLPAAYTWRERIFARFMTRQNARAAAHIFVPSAVTRDALIAQYHIAPEKITVTPLALPCVRQRPALIASEKIPQPYFLFVGRLEYKKGVDLLVSAFAQLGVAHNARLVLVGKPGAGYDAIARAITTSPARAKIFETGYVSDAQLAALYAGAAAFVLPSRYEGFGFNVLEAMAAGVPVIAAAAGSIPEVAGGAAILFHDVPALVSALEKILVMDAATRADLIAAGQVRAQEFNWEKTARATIDKFFNVQSPAF